MALVPLTRLSPLRLLMWLFVDVAADDAAADVVVDVDGVVDVVDVDVGVGVAHDVEVVVVVGHG